MPFFHLDTAAMRQIKDYTREFLLTADICHKAFSLSPLNSSSSTPKEAAKRAALAKCSLSISALSSSLPPLSFIAKNRLVFCPFMSSPQSSRWDI